MCLNYTVAQENNGDSLTGIWYQALNNSPMLITKKNEDTLSMLTFGGYYELSKDTLVPGSYSRTRYIPRTRQYRARTSKVSISLNKEGQLNTIFEDMISSAYRYVDTTVSPFMNWQNRMRQVPHLKDKVIFYGLWYSNHKREPLLVAPAYNDTLKVLYKNRLYKLVKDTISSEAVFSNFHIRHESARLDNYRKIIDPSRNKQFLDTDTVLLFCDEDEVKFIFQGVYIDFSRNSTF